MISWRTTFGGAAGFALIFRCSTSGIEDPLCGLSGFDEFNWTARGSSSNADDQTSLCKLQKNTKREELANQTDDEIQYSFKYDFSNVANWTVEVKKQYIEDFSDIWAKGAGDDFETRVGALQRPVRFSSGKLLGRLQYIPRNIDGSVTPLPYFVKSGFNITEGEDQKNMRELYDNVYKSSACSYQATCHEPNCQQRCVSYADLSLKPELQNWVMEFLEKHGLKILPETEIRTTPQTQHGRWEPNEHHLKLHIDTRLAEHFGEGTRIICTLPNPNKKVRSTTVSKQTALPAVSVYAMWDEQNVGALHPVLQYQDRLFTKNRERGFHPNGHHNFAPADCIAASTSHGKFLVPHGVATCKKRGPEGQELDCDEPREVLIFSVMNLTEEAIKKILETDSNAVVV